MNMLSCENTAAKSQVFAVRYKTWTLDSGLDCGLEYGLDYGLDFGLEFCHLKKTINAGLPNEQGIGITVETDTCAAFSKTGWLVEGISLCLYSLPAQLVGKDS